MEKALMDMERLRFMMRTMRHDLDKLIEAHKRGEITDAQLREYVAELREYVAELDSLAAEARADLQQ
jgi:pyrroloquinoline quinone (PQQ) biosynthesis protein C